MERVVTPWGYVVDGDWVAPSAVDGATRRRLLAEAADAGRDAARDGEACDPDVWLGDVAPWEAIAFHGDLVDPLVVGLRDAYRRGYRNAGAST